jgi:hypothetical protein
MAIPYLYPTGSNTIPYGSRAVTFNFSGGGTGFVILERFEVSDGTWEASRTDQLGVPNGFVLGQEPRRGTATAQLASTATTYAARGDTFNTNVKNATAVTFVVTEATDPEEPRGLKMQNVTFREVI